MILKTARVKNFKCIRDSTAFTIDEKVTCLVGKNESGKTALMQALSKLNPLDPGGADFDILEYPRRHMMEYQQRAATEPAEALVTTWSLSPEDTADLERVIGPAAAQIETIGIEKGYDNKTLYSFEIDEEAVVQHLIDSHELTKDELRNLQGVRTLEELHQGLSGLSTRSERQHDLLVAVISNFEDYNVHAAVARELQGHLPTIVYFSEYLQMPGQISVNDLKSRLRSDHLEEGDRIFLALLDMIGRSVDDLERIDQHEMLTAELEAASNRLTQEVFHYWTQNPRLRVQFLLQPALPGDPAPFDEGWIIRTRIQNTRYGDTINFDERSAGFVWFFSFVVWFSQIRKSMGDNLMLLLDDPGLSLHAKAQADLLRYIEERLAPNYQVIYTTHSPFMVDASKLSRVRTVENIFIEAGEGEPSSAAQDLGTTVGDHELSTNVDTLFPLRAALAYQVSQSLFASEHSVLVEGPSEVLYLQWFKRKLASLGKTTLDDRWVVTPCGGIDRVAAFLALFAGGRPHVAIVTDLASSQRGSVADPRDPGLLRNAHVFTMNTYAGKEEAEIEDLIGHRAYVQLVQLAYNLAPEDARSIQRIGNSPASVVEQVEGSWKDLPQRIGKFDRYRPAEFLILQSAEFTLPDLDRAVGRFEALFRDLNAMLSWLDSRPGQVEAAPSKKKGTARRFWGWVIGRP